jgi:apolipoprotein N-acyltransferase
MKFSRNIVVPFFASMISGLCLDAFTYREGISFTASLVFCLGLIPFFWGILQEKKTTRFAAFIGFSLPISFLVGEGIWHSLRYYYQVPFLPSVLIFTGWVWVAGCLKWLILSLLCKKWLCPGPDSLWLLPFGWMAIEFLYGKTSIQGSSFDLGLLSPLSPLSKIFARTGGVHAVSFFYVCVNAFILALICPDWRKKVLIKKWFIPFGFLLAMGLGDLLFRSGEMPFEKPIHIALLQPNLTILRQQKIDQTTQQRVEKLADMTRTALEKNVDLIVWPAAVLSIKDNSEVSYAIKLIGEKSVSRSKILLGVVRTVMDRAEEKMQNTVYFLNTLGQIEDIYVKQKLTPYTEYIPCSFLDFIGRRRQGILPFLSSDRPGKVFSMEHVKWGNLICVEIYYPNLLRKYIKQGADFLVHFSNDDAFGDAQFKSLLVKLSALRAVELGIPILRESITGISAHISPEGENMGHIPSGQEGIVYATLTRKNQPTFYACFGDVFSYISLFIMVWGIWQSRRQKKLF